MAFAGNWTYSGDPTTSEKDAVRFWLQDTDENRKLLSDQEIAYVQTVSDPIYADPIACAAIACSAVMAKFAKEAPITADGVSVGIDQLQAHFKDLRAQLKDLYDEVAGASGVPLVFGIDVFEIPDFGIKPPSFGKGFTDNPRAGNQEYGLRELFAPVPGEIPESGYWTG